MKTFIAVLLMITTYIIILAGLNALFGALPTALYMFFGLPFTVIFMADALQNYSFFNEA